MIGTMIRDKRVLGLIGKYLRRGAMADGMVDPARCPLLANIYLDAQDKELNIYVNSQWAAERGRCVGCRAGSGSPAFCDE
jgi:hypothetical protein